jgi:hypothetical protein
VQALADDEFDAPPLMHLARFVGTHLPTGVYELDVSSLHIVDVATARAAADPAATERALLALGLASSAAHADRAVAQDRIACAVKGTLEARAFDVQATVPYRDDARDPKSDPAFRAAVGGCLDRLAEQIARARSA